MRAETAAGADGTRPDAAAPREMQTDPGQDSIRAVSSRRRSVTRGSYRIAALAGLVAAVALASVRPAWVLISLLAAAAAVHLALGVQRGLRGRAAGASARDGREPGGAESQDARPAAGEPPAAGVELQAGMAPRP